MDRRSFVKACVTTAGAGALAASGLGMVAGLEIPRKAGLAPLVYFGTHRVAGPAPRGLPYIPLRLEGDKFVGRPTIPHWEDGEPEINVLEWYKYCGHSGAPGLKLDFASDNTLTYLSKEEYGHIITPWFMPYLAAGAGGDGARPLGQAVAPSHFPGDNFGAAFEWRSENAALGPNVLTGIITRVAASELARPVDSVVPPGKPITQAQLDYLKREVFVEKDGSLYIGVSSFCTHFCCAPGYRESEKLARPRDAWDNIFCTCHNSNYNFRQPVTYNMSPEVATEAGGFDPLLTRGGRSDGGASSGGGGH